MQQLKRLLTLVFLAAALRVFFHLLSTPLGWDASVYQGMAKAIAGMGGLWEPLRPIIWPLMLAPFSFLGIDVVIVAHLLQFFMGMGVVLLVYAITKKSFGETAGLWALLFVALSPLLAFYEHQLITEQPAVFFALLAVFFLQCSWFFISGMFASIAFLTKFPEGLVLLALGAALVFSSKTVKEWFAHSTLLGAGFLLPLLPFFALNWILYQNPFAAITAANDVIATSGLWLYLEGPLFYFKTIVFENIFLVFAIPGAILALRREKGTLATLFSAVLVLAYLIHLPHKEVRFIPLFIPFVIILAAAGWNLIWTKFECKKLFPLIVMILLAIFLAQGLRWGQYYATYEGAKGEEWTSIYVTAANSDAPIVSSDPRITLFTSKKIIPLYYPLFPENLTEGLLTLKGARTLLFNPCDTPCSTQDTQCQLNLHAFESIVNATWVIIEEIPGNCPFRLYTHS